MKESKGPEIRGPELEDLVTKMCIRYQTKLHPIRPPFDWRSSSVGCGIITDIKGPWIGVLINIGGSLEQRISIHYTQVRVAWQVYGFDPIERSRGFLS